MKETHKRERITSLIARLSAEYISRDSSGSLLLTITQAVLLEDRKCATIFFTAFPETREGEALTMLKREAGAVRRYINDHARIVQVPFLRFEVDQGEKNRQKIEALSKADSASKTA